MIPSFAHKNPPGPASSDRAGPPQSILICEANPILADGVRELLRRDPYLSGFIIDINRIPDLEMCRSLAPSVLIIDPWQGTDSWQSTSADYMELSKATALIGYCPEVTTAEARAISCVGFRGITPKTVTSEELVRIVICVALGGIYIHEKYTENLYTSHGADVLPASSSHDLTEREYEVLRHVALGSSTKEIAAVLHISTKTVDTYKTRANAKLNLRSRSDIVRFAILSGWMN